MPNFAKSAAAVRTISLEQTAQQFARNGRMDNISDTQAVPEPVITSMQAQGMWGQNAFSPGTPVNPSQPVGSEPRQFEYMIGQNIVQRPRSTESVSFSTIRSVIEMYDVAQMAIEVRQDELRNLDWNIVPIDEDDTKLYESEIKQARAFFEKPDGHMLFDDFQNQLAYDWLAFDALTIYPHLTRGGKLGALEPVDGTTITPMVDIFGRQPEAPAPAYVQWMYGVPWVWLNREELIYRPFRRRTNKLYGYTPVEWLLNAINTDIRYQLYFLHYFTEGSVPETWVNAPESVQDPKQIEELQKMYDTVMAGDQRQKHKVKWIPAGSKVTNAKDTKFDVNFPQFLLTKACAAWKVTPAELGFTEKVNKSSGETQENVQYRRSIKPSAQFFQRIYTGIVQKYFSPNLQFKYVNLNEQEDELVKAQIDDLDIKNGIISPDEARSKRRGLDVDGKTTPRLIITGSSVMVLDDAIKQSAASVKATENLANGGDTGKPDENEPDDEPKPDEPKPPAVKEKDDAEKSSMKDFFVNRTMS